MLEKAALASAEEVNLVLIQAGILFCKDSGARTIRLDTHYRNTPARCLYEKWGFKSLDCYRALVDNVMREFDVFEYLF